MHGRKEEIKKPSGKKPAFESEEEMNLPALWSHRSFGIEKISNFLSVRCMKKKKSQRRKQELIVLKVGLACRDGPIW